VQKLGEMQEGTQEFKHNLWALPHDRKMVECLRNLWYSLIKINFVKVMI